MHRASRRWFWLALIAFLATRLVDVHLHLCFDGQEPPTTVHVSNGAVDSDAHHADESHSDRNVNVFDAVLVKKLADPSDALIPVLASALLLLLLPVRGRCVPRMAQAPLVVRSLLLLKPPLRGPPR